MTTLINIAAIAAGGALGAVARYLVTLGTNQWMLKTGGHLPMGTLLVNVLGSFLFGLLLMLLLKLHDTQTLMRLFLLTGFLGSFTTFSTFSFETVALLQSGHTVTALVSIAANLLGALSAFWLASKLSTMLFSL